MLLGWYFPESVGGTEVYIKNLSKELNDKNYEVQVAIPSLKENYFYEDLKVNCYKPNSDINVAVLRGLSPPDNLISFAELIRKVGPDIVHFHTLGTDCGNFHINTVKKLNIPTLLTVHVPGVLCPRGTFLQWGELPCDRTLKVDKCSECLLNSRGIPKFLSKALVSIQKNESNILTEIPKIGITFNTKKYIADWIDNMKLSISGVDHVVVVSEWLIDTIQKNSIETEGLSLSLHGINNLNKGKTLKKKKVNKEIVFSYIGRMDFIKGIHILINSFTALNSNSIKLKLYGVTNSKEERNYMKQMLSNSKNDKRISFEGEINDNNRQDIMNEIDVLIVPSICYETGPMVLLEAYEFKIPVIGSNLGGISEKIKDGETGLTFEAGNINSLKNKIQQVVDNPDLIEKFSSNINYEYTIDDVANQMDKLYRSFI